MTLSHSRIGRVAEKVILLRGRVEWTRGDCYSTTMEPHGNSAVNVA